MGVGVSVLVVETTLLGSSDLRVSRIALGCMSYGDPGAGLHSWTLDEEAAQPFFRQAVELGVTFWDTANVYQQGTSEEYVGRAVRRYARRQDIVLATKVFGRMHDGPTGGGLSRAAIHAQCDASLRRLGTDHIDVYVIHRFDEAVPVEETMAALHELVVAGKVRHLGASSMWAWQFAKLQTAARGLAVERLHRLGGGGVVGPAVPLAPADRSALNAGHQHGGGPACRDAFAVLVQLRLGGGVRGPPPGHVSFGQPPGDGRQVRFAHPPQGNHPGKLSLSAHLRRTGGDWLDHLVLRGRSGHRPGLTGFRAAATTLDRRAPSGTSRSVRSDAETSELGFFRTSARALRRAPTPCSRPRRPDRRSSSSPWPHATSAS